MNKLRLVVNNKLNQKENFFVRKELQTILNLYAQKVSCGDWKDYGLSINRKEISFDIYHRTSEVPIFKISKNLNPKNKIEKFYILDKNSNVIKQSENLENLINKTKWEKLRLVK
jgi:ribosomal protein S24E